MPYYPASSGGKFALISDFEVASAGTSVDFSNLPVYRAYVFFIAAVVDNTASPYSNVQVRLNGDSGSNYTYVVSGGVSSAATTAGTGASGTYIHTLTGTMVASYRLHGTLQVTVSPNLTQYDSTAIDFTGTSGAGTPGYVHSGGNWTTKTQTNRVTIVFDQNIQKGSRFSVYGVT